MATSVQPTRSVSLPCRSNFEFLKIEESLNKLNSQDLPSASDIQLGLQTLFQIYANLQHLIFSPSSHQALFNQDERKYALIEEALERSVGLIDRCNNVRELLLSLKEHVGDLESALRRKGCFCVEREVKEYICFRKTLGKDIARCLRVFKQAKYASSHETPHSSLVTLIRLIYEVTIRVFRSVLLFLSVPSHWKANSSVSGWLFVSRLVGKRGGVDSVEIANEVAVLDVALHRRDGACLAPSKIQALDGVILLLEDGVESLYRCLVQHRVSLLNLLTH